MESLAEGRRLADQGRKPEAVAALVTAARATTDPAEAADLHGVRSRGQLVAAVAGRPRR